MPKFNNCKTGINIKNSSTARFSSPMLIKDASNVGIALNNNCFFKNDGVSGSTGSSINVISSTRGIQLDKMSRADLQNASIKDTRYGVVSANASFFNFNQSSINAGSYSSFTGQSYGIYATDSSIGNVFSTSITGYPGATASLTNGNMAIAKNAILFVGTTSQANNVNITALGAALPGDVVVDVTLGNKIVLGDPVFTVMPDEEYY
jgi:hypothetical protein